MVQKQNTVGTKILAANPFIIMKRALSILANFNKTEKS